MFVKSGLVLATLLIGSLALPKNVPETDMSEFFIHADQNARIVGGTIAPEGSAPWMGALSDGLLIRSFICGSSIISSRTFLTAAHCIQAIFSSIIGLSRNARIQVGSNRSNQGGISYNLSRNVTHANYVHSIIKNDVGLLISSTVITFNDNIAPVPLSFDFIPGNTQARATGWGRIGQGQSLSTQLLELEMTIMDGYDCITTMAIKAAELNFRAPTIEPHIEICTTHHNGAGFGMCNGDSGSALVDIETGNQVGVVSWGLPCALGAPDVFARVSGFKDWFEANIVE